MSIFIVVVSHFLKFMCLILNLGYTCKSVLREKLGYAIHFCKSIDNDEYARVAAPAEVLIFNPSGEAAAATNEETGMD